MIKCMFVPIKDIAPRISRDILPSTKVDELAQSIVECGGLIRPLLVQKTEFDRETFEQKFKLVTGDIYYWASVKAKELDPSLEDVNAFVLAEGQDSKPFLTQFK